MSRDALIVGINSYQHLPDLKAPALDAEAIAQRLEEDGDISTLYRYPEVISQLEDKKIPVVSQSKTVSEIQLRKAITQLFLNKSAQAPKTALFYFSGHGLSDSGGFDKGHLAASDTNPNSLSSRLSLRWLHWVLSQSPIEQQIVWVDCCHSGSLIVNLNDANPGYGKNKDRCFIASSRDFESSYEDLNSDYSVFTKALLDGLDPFRSLGGRIDTFELVKYVKQALKGQQQTPVCTNFGKAINLTEDRQHKVQLTNDDETDSGICPYKGLEFFDCNDEDPKYFFGREQMIGQLLEKARTSKFIALVGASGNGKSSVLRAGLLHQLKLGERISGSDQWRIRITRPDRQPMQNLALTFVEEGLSVFDLAEEQGKVFGILKEGVEGLLGLIEKSKAPRTVLVIDQFEEVFTRCENQEERGQFFDCLMGALSNADDKLCLIIAMRADFIVKCMEQEYCGLAQQIDQHMVSVLPMKANELRAAIYRPAEQVGLQVEPTLVTEILNDIEGAPGSLPLLQYTLKELWHQRQGNQLTLSSYQILGGIQGTLDQRATAIYNSLDKAEQQTVQHIFQQLTQLGEGTEDTRRRVFQADLVADPMHPAQRVQQVIERLSSPENRLIVTDEVVSKSDELQSMSIVDVAHEALIRHWSLLQQWIEQNRDLLRKQRKIEANAIVWRNQNQKTGYLLQGLPLIEAIQFKKNQSETFPLSDNSKAFIQKSQRQRHLNRLKTGAWLIIPALSLLVLIEHNIRESGVKGDYARLDGEGTYEEKQAVEGLVRGCKEQKDKSGLPNYLAERLFGNCRSLFEAPLEKANLRFADLSSANLSSAYLSSADLSYANFSSADLSIANLSSANLSSTYLSSADLTFANLRSANLTFANLRRAYLSSANLSRVDLSIANLSSADLRRANLRSSILLRTDLRETINLSQAQLEGKEHPLICNSPLPQNIKIDLNRDCDKVAAALHERFSEEFPTLEKAEKYVKKQRQKKWN